MGQAVTDEERQSLRDLQDRWLATPAVRSQVENFGDGWQIIPGLAGAAWPAFRDVREALYPELRTWFEDFFREDL